MPLIRQVRDKVKVLAGATRQATPETATAAPLETDAAHRFDEAIDEAIDEALDGELDRIRREWATQPSHH